MLKSERIDLVPFEMKYLEDYFNGFNAEITKFQWPEPFAGIEEARAVLQAFLDEMERGEALLFSILSKSHNFLGSVEIQGLAGDCPELGIWIVQAEQNKGYAYEALSAALGYLRSQYGKGEFYYEADLRNTGSRKLLHKFDERYEIVAQKPEKVTTDSGKELELQGYLLKER